MSPTGISNESLTRNLGNTGAMVFQLELQSYFKVEAGLIVESINNNNNHLCSNAGFVLQQKSQRGMALISGLLLGHPTSLLYFFLLPMHKQVVERKTRLSTAVQSFHVKSPNSDIQRRVQVNALTFLKLLSIFQAIPALFTRHKISIYCFNEGVSSLETR